MIYLIIGGLLVAAVYGGAGHRILRERGGWRITSAVFAVLLFAAAGFIALRGGWGKAIVLAVIGMGLTLSARRPRPAPWKLPEAMSASEARATLGVGPQASVEEIKAAYARLIQRVHPDRGGAPGLAAHLNLARDTLLKS